MRLQALIVFGSSVMQRLAVLVMTVLAARIIGAAELGKFAIIYATCVNLTGFIGDALAATVNREIPLASKRSVESRQEMAGMLLSFCLLLAVSLCILSAVFASVLSRVTSGGEELTSYIRISSIMTLCLLPNTVCNALLNSIEKNLVAAVVASSGAILSVGLGLLGAFKYAAFGMCVGFAVGSGMLSLAYFTLMRKYFSSNLVSISNIKKYFKARIFSSFTFPTMATMALGGPVHWICMSFLGSTASGVREIAVFSAMFQWYSILTFIPAALMNFTVPWLAKAKAEGDAQFKARAKRIISAILLVVGVLLIFVVIFEPYILGLYGPDFAEDGGVLVLLAVCGFLASLITVLNQISWAAGKTWSNLLTASTYGAVYIIGAFVCIRILHFGAAGLGWGILCASLVQGAIQIKFAFANQSKK